jgi:hypothetical protein
LNELDLLTELWDEVPLSAPSRAGEEVVLAAISREVLQRAGGRRRHQARTLALATAALATAGLAVALAVVSAPLPLPPEQHFAWSGYPNGPVRLRLPSLGRAGTLSQLADYATRAAALAPGRAPRADQWVFMKTEVATSSAGNGGFLFGPPDGLAIGLAWTKVDWSEDATLHAHMPANLRPGQLVHGTIWISPDGGGTLCGWPSVSYSYLSSLPANPAALAAMIRTNNAPDVSCHIPGPDNVMIFEAIRILLQGETEGAWVPPRLAATMYRVLQQLPGVRFDAGVDLAGRPGVGLYLVEGGWLKEELVINPMTYQFMGSEAIAVHAHVSVGADGTRHIRTGQVLDWMALLATAIVDRPGQLP